MVHVELGSNQLPVTLRDRLQSVSPNILMRLIYTQATSEDKVMLVSDVSGPDDRISLLEVEVVSNPNLEDLANGIVYLKSGNYHYEIYESADTVLNVSGKCLRKRGILRYNFDHSDGIDYERTVNEIVY